VGRWHAGKHGTGAVSALDEDRQADGCEHENDGRPGCYLGEQVGCTARAERSLGALTAEGSGKVGAFTLLKQDDPNQDDANDNVNSTNQPDHANLNEWCGRGDLNPHASRRHPLKMVCLPISPLPRYDNYSIQLLTGHGAQGHSVRFCCLN
jgi:hypothetical protein